MENILQAMQSVAKPPVLQGRKQSKYRKFSLKVLTTAALGERELLALIDSMVHEAYLAGVTQGRDISDETANDTEGYIDIPEICTSTGEAVLLANLWCKDKGTRL